MELEKDRHGLGLVDESLKDRATRIRRRFKAGRLDTMGRRFWETWRSEDAGLLVGMYSSVLILFLEPALWSESWPADMTDVRVPDRLAAWLLLVLPFNGWLLDRFLSSKTPREISLPWKLIVLRRILASLPLLGLYTLSLWKGMLVSDISARPQNSASLDLSLRRSRLPKGMRSRVLYRSGFFFVWLACGLLPLLVWVLWLAQTRALGSLRQPVIAGVCFLLHLAASLSMARYFRNEIRNPMTRTWRKVLFLIAPFLWLLGLPGMISGMFLFLWSDPPHTSLTWKAHATRSGAGRDPRWRGLQAGLRQQWQRKPWFMQWSRPAGLSRAEDPGEAEARVVSLYRLKTLLLLLDGAAAFQALPVTLRRAAFPGIVWGTAVLAFVGFLLAFTALLARLLRASLAQSLKRYPYGRYLLLTQLALLAGVFEASLWSAGRIQEFGALLCLGSALCGVSAVLFFLPTAGSPNGPDMTLWGGLFLSLSAMGALIVLDGKTDQTSITALLVLATLTPIWSFGLSLGLSSWLLRPFSLRQVFDRSLPGRMRIAIGFLSLTTALPLGGVFIPAWICVRRSLESSTVGRHSEVSKL